MTEPVDDDQNLENEAEPRAWVWFNKDPTFPKATVSVLALVETVIATWIVAYIALRFGTLHLTISAIVAPILLLRTEWSTQRGVQLGMSERLENAIDAIGTSPERNGVVEILQISAIITSAGAWALFSRVFSTATSAIRHPSNTVAAIPINWWRAIAGVDSTSRIEPLPGAPRDRLGLAEIYDPSSGISELSKMLVPDPNDDWLGKIAHVVASIALLPLLMAVSVFLAFPALLYRYSLKGTALLYSPLVYLAHSSFRGPASERLESLRSLAFHQVMRAYAAFVLVLFLGKVYLWAAWDQFQAAWQQIPSVEILSAYVVPDAIAPWHLASAVTAAMTWGIYFFADAMLFKFRSKPAEALEASVASNVIRFLWFVRGILSLYTIACVVYITASLVPSIDWPPLGANLFPWTASTAR